MIQILSNIAQNYYLITEAELYFTLYGVAFFYWLICVTVDTVNMLMKNSRWNKFKNQLPPN